MKAKEGGKTGIKGKRILIKERKGGKDSETVRGKSPSIESWSV